jgi:transposase
LSALIKQQMQLDPVGGAYFVFVNRRKTQMKVLYFESSGYCIWNKRLEQGQFQVRPHASGQKALGWTDFQWLLDGIEVQKYKQFKRYRHAA